MKDLKEALSSGRKPDITHMRRATMVYVGRGCEYGDKTQGGKYERANFLRPAGQAGSIKEEFVRHRGYLRAGVSHLMQILDRMELHQSMDPDLEDEEGMKMAVGFPDSDAMPGCPVGASFLPEHCGAIASLNMAIAQAVEYGLLPKDPGQPWRNAPAEKTENSEMTAVYSVTHWGCQEALSGWGGSGGWMFAAQRTRDDEEEIYVSNKDIIEKRDRTVFVRTGAPLFRAKV